MSSGSPKKTIHGYVSYFNPECPEHFEAILVDKEGIMGEKGAEYDVLLPMSAVDSKDRGDIEENIIFKWEFNPEDLSDSKVELLRYTEEDIARIQQEAEALWTLFQEVFKDNETAVLPREKAADNNGLS